MKHCGCNLCSQPRVHSEEAQEHYYKAAGGPIHSDLSKKAFGPPPFPESSHVSIRRAVQRERIAAYEHLERIVDKVYDDLGLVLPGRGTRMAS